MYIVLRDVRIRKHENYDQLAQETPNPKQDIITVSMTTRYNHMFPQQLDIISASVTQCPRNMITSLNIEHNTTVEIERASEMYRLGMVQESNKYRQTSSRYIAIPSICSDFSSGENILCVSNIDPAELQY